MPRSTSQPCAKNVQAAVLGAAIALLGAGAGPSAAQGASPRLRPVASHAPARLQAAPASQRQMPGPLSKAHEAIADTCEACHDEPGKVTARNCLGCHQPIAERMAQKRGVHRDVTGDCESCHVEHQGPDADLRPLDRSAFDHAAETGFPLDGQHAALREACARCHTTRSFLELSPSCARCHQDPHGGQMDQPCAACHTPAGFRTPNRAFHKSTVFPLEGRHLAVPCQSCHVNGQMKGTPTRCYDCHWIRRQDDRYQTRLGNQCEECHRPVSWTAVNWEHGARTGTPLNVAHRLLACDSCHKSATFRGARPECIACHDDDYRSARDPDHAAAGFPTSCDLCHRPSAPTFGGATFVHAAFALVGPHATQPCAGCHRNNVYRGTPRDCVGCHLADYQRAQSPNHASAGFPTTCDVCHRPTDASWRGAGAFNHGAIFQLAGRHATTACASCHRNNQYRGTPRDCVACHLADYQRAQSPNHASAGFPTACERCHRSGGPGWSGTGFNHNQFFALQGVHALQPCASCHPNGRYRGTPRDCAGCHLARYQSTRNPNHVAAGFPTTCEACHRASDTSWNQGRFNHTWFPITSGRHAGNACAACHPDPNNFRTFNCLTCHDRAETDREHSGRAGYRYDSNACYSCHPQGRAD